MSREYCLFVLEGGSGTTPYCTPVAPAASANIWTTAASTGIPSTASGANNYAGFYARLDGGDSFTMRPRPVPVTVPYGGGFAVPAFTVSDKQMRQARADRYELRRRGSVSCASRRARTTT